MDATGALYIQVSSHLPDGGMRERERSMIDLCLSDRIRSIASRTRSMSASLLHVITHNTSSSMIQEAILCSVTFFSVIGSVTELLECYLIIIFFEGKSVICYLIF
jgi:hypothetical protein